MIVFAASLRVRKSWSTIGFNVSAKNSTNAAPRPLRHCENGLYSWMRCVPMIRSYDDAPSALARQQRHCLAGLPRLAAEGRARVKQVLPVLDTRQRRAYCPRRKRRAGTTAQFVRCRAVGFLPRCPAAARILAFCHAATGYGAQVVRMPFRTCSSELSAISNSCLQSTLTYASILSCIAYNCT